MAHRLLSTYNLTEGLHIPLLVYPNDVTGGIFIPILIFMVWCMITFSSYFIQRQSTTSGDIPQVVAVSGFVTLIFTFLLKLIPNLVNDITFAVVIIVFLFSVFWLFMDKQ